MDKLFLGWAVFSFIIGVYCTGAIAFVIAGTASDFVLVIVAVSVLSWLISTFSVAKAVKMDIE